VRLPAPAPAGWSGGVSLTDVRVAEAELRCLSFCIYYSYMRAEQLLLLKCCSIRRKFDGEIPPEKANRLWDRAVFLTGNLATAGRYDYLAPDFLISVRIPFLYNKSLTVVVHLCC